MQIPVKEKSGICLGKIPQFPNWWFIALYLKNGIYCWRIFIF